MTQATEPCPPPSDDDDGGYGYHGHKDGNNDGLVGAALAECRGDVRRRKRRAKRAAARILALFPDHHTSDESPELSRRGGGKEESKQEKEGALAEQLQQFAREWLLHKVALTDAYAALASLGE